MHRWTRRAGVALSAMAVGAGAWLVAGPHSADASGTGTVSGRVTDAAGKPLSGIWVEPYAASGSKWIAKDARVVGTAGNGTYSLTLDSGDYRLCFYSQDESHALGCWGGESTAASGSTVSVASGASVTHKNMAMPVAASISGTVTDSDGKPVKDLVVSAYQNEGGTWRAASADYTAADGTYDIGGLRAGAYRVAFADKGSYATYPTTFWPTAITLGAGGSATSIDSVETEGGVISGTVTDFQGDDVSGVEVDVYANSGGTWTKAASATVRSGAYTVAGLPDGTYRVGFANEDSDGPYKAEFYTGSEPGADTVDAAADVTVTEGNVSTVGAKLEYTDWVPADPAIGGSARVGSTLTVLRADSWRPSTDDLSYQWYASGVALPGETSTKLTVTPALRGKLISVTVRAEAPAAGLAPADATAKAKASIGLGVFTRAPKPRLTGVARAGRELHAVVGNWSPAPAGLTYQWYADGHRIAGATHRSLRVTRALRGHRISVHVTASARGYHSTMRYSLRTARAR